MTKEERIKKSLSEFADACIELNRNLDEFLGKNRNLQIEEKVIIDNSSVEDIRTIIHKLAYSEYIFAYFYQNHIVVPKEGKDFNAYMKQVVDRYLEDSAAETEKIEYKIWKENRDSEEEPNDEYESEGDGFCNFCHERPCACSDRDN